MNISTILDELKATLLKLAAILESMKPSNNPPEPQNSPVVPSTAQKLVWDTPEHVRHSIRVMCDNAGMTYEAKNILTACIYQESNFQPRAIGKPNSNGTIDYGLCQYNTGKNPRTGQAYWIGPGAAFATIEEVLSSPEKNVEIMIQVFKAGKISLWSSYKTGAYKKWLLKVTKPVPPAGHY